MQTKTCGRCRKPRPIHEFKRLSGGKRSQLCAPCAKARVAAPNPARRRVIVPGHHTRTATA